MDELVVKRLNDFMEIENDLSLAKKEIQLHRMIVTARREMENKLARLEEQIHALELKKQDEQKTYEEKLRVLQGVTLHALICKEN